MTWVVWSIGVMANSLVVPWACHNVVLLNYFWLYAEAFCFTLLVVLLLWGGGADWPEFRPLRNTSNWCVKTLLTPCCCTVTRALAVREIFSSFVRTGMQLCDNLFRGVFREYKSRLICSWRSPGILHLLLSPALSSLYILACVNWRIFAFQQLMMFAGWQIWKELIGLNTSRY